MKNFYKATTFTTIQVSKALGDTCKLEAQSQFSKYSGFNCDTLYRSVPVTALSKLEVMLLINRDAAQFYPVPTLEGRNNHIRINR